jgi:type IV secretory pathway VirB6-like protein
MLWNFVKAHRSSAVFLVVVWMVTLLILAIIGPVFRP